MRRNAVQSVIAAAGAIGIAGWSKVAGLEAHGPHQRDSVSIETVVLPSDLQLTTVACGTNAYVQYTRSIYVPFNPTDYGDVSLWYSAACRSVNAQYVSTIPCDPFDQGCGFTKTQYSTGGAGDSYCASPQGGYGCKAPYFTNDAGLQQRAYAQYDTGGVNGTAYGWTPFW